MTLANSTVPDCITEHLADREGLRGAARRRFTNFLNESLGYGARPRRIPRFVFAAVAVPPALAGFVEFLGGAGMVAVGAWFMWSVAVLALSFRLSVDEPRPASPVLDAEWEIYCHLFRPLILTRLPGLLDRNLRACPTPMPWLYRPRANLIFRLPGRGSDTPAWLVPTSLAFGLVVLVGLRMAFPVAGWLMAIVPIAGAAAVLLAWGLWQSAAVLWVRHHAIRNAEML